MLLLRHGKAQAAPGAPYREATLTETGRRQAAAVAKSLQQSPPTAVFSSPSPRAAQTAEIICGSLSLPYRTDPRLEEFRFGSFDDPKKTIETLQAERSDLLIWPYDFRIVPDAETLEEFATRVAAVLQEIAQRHVYQQVLVVAHAGTLDAAIRWAVGLLPKSNWEHEFPFSCCSLTELLYWPQGRVKGKAPRYAEFRKLASVEHLPPGLRTDV
jgi:probable phosphoglycerate mutase